jgi:ferric-dicitrate binding protein FerR (iron transport regulator)
MDDRDERARDVTLEAAEWYVANRAGLDAHERLMFTRWLKFSPANVREYLAITNLARDLRRGPWADGGSFAAIRRVYGRLGDEG